MEVTDDCNYRRSADGAVSLSDKPHCSLRRKTRDDDDVAEAESGDDERNPSDVQEVSVESRQEQEQRPNSHAEEQGDERRDGGEESEGNERVVDVHLGESLLLHCSLLVFVRASLPP